MQDFRTAWPVLIPFGILFVLAAMLAFALLVIIERPNAEDGGSGRWKSRVRWKALSVMRRHRFDLVFGTCLGAAVTVISWLLLSLSSLASHGLQRWFSFATPYPA
jgi:hypothetical protein